jgi:hypothetical protein
MWRWERFGGQSDSFNKHRLRCESNVDHHSGFEWGLNLIVESDHESNYELFDQYLRERDAFTGLDPGMADHSIHGQCARRRNR